MTHRERELLRFIERYIAENDGVAPTFTEMAAAIGLASKSGVLRIILSLERQGRVRREANQTRAVRPAAVPLDLSKATDGALLAEVAARGLLRAEGVPS